ncbi:MAG: M48 family metalloprotease [Desulfobacteraceae bacterium]|nr:M48 family metalloprotease [Desulfobacteraceae bacterium]
MAKIKNPVVFSFCIIFIFSMCVCFPSKSDALAIGKEKELAKEYMTIMKNSGLIIKDPIITNLVKNIGKEITATLPPQPFKYSFFVLSVDDFNAFAIPGANIFVNIGLITSLDTVDELAGILAHETAHSANRHIAQLIDKSKVVSIATFAGIIAGVIAGSQGEGDLGQALAMGSVAAGHSAMLSYTREHETEADQKGFEYLLKTSFSPLGLLSSLKKIRIADFYGTDDIPDYFKTHPGTKKRIASLEILFARYPKISKPAQSSKKYNFDMIKYRIIGLYKNSIESNKIFTKLLQKDPDSAAYHYGYALALKKQLKFDKANIHLKRALAIKPFDPLILFEISNIYLHNGETQKAVNILKSIENDPAVKSSVFYSLGQAQLELGNLKLAKSNLIKVISDPATTLPKAYYYIAKIYSKENNPGLKHFYLGHYYFEIRNNKNTRIHLKKALETLSDKQKIKEANEILKKVKEPSHH